MARPFAELLDDHLQELVLEMLEYGGSRRVHVAEKIIVMGERMLDALD